MNISRKLLLSLFAGTLLFGLNRVGAQSATTNQTDDARTYFEVLRSDFNAAKIRTINQAMKLTSPEAEVFWPIYRDYEKELARVGDEKLALIREFAAHYQKGSLNDQNAKPMAAKWLKNVQSRLDLWTKYHKKISATVSPMRAAQFLQVENQMALFVDIGIASEMPQITPTLPQKPSQ
ncbi:MAG TPA: hypothetical protein P5205_02010 [Candidatus Paceibacterota bacterium]|nr:hypothetical protein [Verrucomicrobiota bacterium]HSA09121.1 hypothetical protein [Candidatus Paceibacterota bacterium]